MIDIIFEFGTEYIFVRINNSNVFFRTQQSQVYATIDGLKLDKAGVIKEFPDLKDNDNWKKEAIKRFKEKLKKMDDEKDKAKYLISELNKSNYVPRYMQVAGHRRIKL